MGRRWNGDGESRWKLFFFSDSGNYLRKRPWWRINNNDGNEALWNNVLYVNVDVREFRWRKSLHDYHVMMITMQWTSEEGSRKIVIYKLSILNLLRSKILFDKFYCSIIFPYFIGFYMQCVCIHLSCRYHFRYIGEWKNLLLVLKTKIYLMNAFANTFYKVNTEFLSRPYKN